MVVATSRAEPPSRAGLTARLLMYWKFVFSVPGTGSQRWPWSVERYDGLPSRSYRVAVVRPASSSTRLPLPRSSHISPSVALCTRPSASYWYSSQMDVGSAAMSYDWRDWTAVRFPAASY